LGGAPSLRARGAKRYRLAGTGAFASIFREGVRSEGAFVQLIAVPARRVPGRVGFVIGRKAFAHAVDRNRVRRVLRAVVTAARPGIELFDVIVRVKRGCARDEIGSLTDEAAQLIATLTTTPAADAAR
jgi:ribonuclease P protein component